MAGLSLYCGSSLGALDSLCLSTPAPVLAIVSPTVPEKVVPQEVSEILGYAMTVCAVFCVYFSVLFLYKIFRGHGVLFSLRFALCGAQRFVFDRTARLSMSYFVTPAVSPAQIEPVNHPAGYPSPVPMPVLTSFTSPSAPVCSETPIYSVPIEIIVLE
jgi:hypothetical protein